jgi:hypothetical protein
VRNAGLHLEAETAQVFGDERGRAELAIGELRMLMDITTPRDDLRLDCGDPRLGRVVQHAALCRCSGEGHARRQHRQQQGGEGSR